MLTAKTSELELMAATRTGLPPAGDDELLVGSRTHMLDLQQSGRTP